MPDTYTIEIAVTFDTSKIEPGERAVKEGLEQMRRAAERAIDAAQRLMADEEAETARVSSKNRKPVRRKTT